MQFKLLLLAGLLTVGQAVAQKGPTKPDMPMDEENVVNYNGVVNMSGLSQSELFKRAHNFMTSYYPSKSVIQSADSTTGTIVGKAQFDTHKEVKGVKSMNDRVKYTVQIDVKEGRYRYQLTKINLQAQSYKPIETYLADSDKDELHIKTLNDAHEEFEKIEQAIRDAMDKPSTKVKKDDW